MRDFGDLHIQRWTVDYCDGSEPETVSVPHAWRQDLPVTFEGPVLYRTTIDVPKTPSKLRFYGVSYAADVSIDTIQVASHTGIWDAFEVPLTPFAGSRVEISVSVVKNGGGTYPVADVASGFLPYVFHTFGGIHGEVCIVEAEDELNLPAPENSRVAVNKSQIRVDGRPFYCRGLLHWGWYPELGHTNVPAETVRKEVRAARNLGFNLVKFCLWIPPQRYLEILKEEGVEAWIELPVWNPSPDPAVQEAISVELERIVRQYRHHDNVLFWTVGCELGDSVTSEMRERMMQTVKNLTGSPMVKDESGGAELFGGDPREYGDFYDYHPYCDTQFYPSVLDALNPGPRVVKPLLLGEFNDNDVHRDLAGLGNEIPYWASNLSELNDKGVRWQYDLPEVLRSNRFALHPLKEHHRELMESSRSKALFVRKTVHEAVRGRDVISGYVVTGWRDTPISSSGFFDDWERPRFSGAECSEWNGPTCIFLIPTRRMPWTNGGNRPGVVDPHNLFTGQILWKVGVHSESGVQGGLSWRLTDSTGRVVFQGAETFIGIPPLTSAEVGQISIFCDRPGEYRLDVEFGNATNSWPVLLVDSLGDGDLAQWSTDDPQGVLGFGSDGGPLRLTSRVDSDLQPGIVLLTGEGTIGRPFWRESAYEFRNAPFWLAVPFAQQWARLLAISPDRAIDTGWLESLGVPYETVLRRIDVRTYAEDPVMVRFGETIITTMRPYGGLGAQPSGIQNNPAGVAFLRGIAEFLSS